MYKKEAPESIQEMFATIATNYDAANQKMSFGLNTLWNKKLIEIASQNRPQKLLDLCAGTGAIALPFLEKNPNSTAILLDFCKEMLDVAKMNGKNLLPRFETLVADAQNIPLPDASVDAITVAYGIRNIKEPQKCFKEAYRLLKTGGIFAILELTRPENPLLRLPHTFYLKGLLPLIGKKIAQNKQAYSYLAKSITEFATPSQIKQDLIQTQFTDTKIIPLWGGIATIISAKK